MSADAPLTPFGKLAQTDLHDIVGYQLAQATVTASQVFQAQVGGASDLRPVEFTILALIEQNPGVAAKHLAQALAVTPPNITMWMERLEARGLVQRERSTTDRRAQHIRNTTRGSVIVRKAIKLLHEGEAAALAALTTAERAILVELLHKVACCRSR